MIHIERLLEHLLSTKLLRLLGTNSLLDDLGDAINHTVDVSGSHDTNREQLAENLSRAAVVVPHHRCSDTQCLQSRPAERFRRVAGERENGIADGVELSNVASMSGRVDVVESQFLNTLLTSLA